MFGEKMHRAKPYALNSEFCRELASEMVRKLLFFSSTTIYMNCLVFRSPLHELIMPRE